MKDTFVFIDGGYLSKITKHFGKGKHIKLDLRQFAVDLAKARGLWCTRIFYYTAPPYQSPKPTPSEARRRANYDKFINKMKKRQDLVVREGRCQKIGNNYNQKGVDTLVVMDLMDVPKYIKTIVLLACDTDFVPVLNRIRERGVKVILYYFNDYKRGSEFSMSNHILTACDECVLLNKKHFENSRLG